MTRRAAAAPPARLSAPLRPPLPPALCGAWRSPPGGLRGRAGKRFCLREKSRRAHAGGLRVPRASVRWSRGGIAEGAGCSEGSRGGLRCRGSSRSLGAGAGTGNGALRLPGAEEAPAERSRARKGRACAGASAAAAPSGRAGTSARRGPFVPPGPGQSSFPWQRKVPGLSRAAPPGGRFRARGGAVEECGDNAPSVTAGSRRGRERRRGR